MDTSDTDAAELPEYDYDYVDDEESRARIAETEQLRAQVRHLRSQRQPLPATAKNRRYTRMRQLETDGSDYFGMDNMKQRNPLMWWQYVGRHVVKDDDAPDSEVAEDVARMMEEASSSRTGAVHRTVLEGQAKSRTMAAQEAADERHQAFTGTGLAVRPDGTTHWAMDLLANWDASEEARELRDGVEAELRAVGASEDDVDLHMAVNVMSDETLTPADVAFMRAEFERIMRERFLSGLDEDVDYAAIDGDGGLDDMGEIGRDEEERYFEGE